MKLTPSLFLIPALLLLFALTSGCGPAETGTRVTLSLPAGKELTRDETSRLCMYLSLRAREVLGSEKARVDSIKGRSVVLLLPGKNATREDVQRLIQGPSLQLYHLKNVSTSAHPERAWRLALPADGKAPYVFTGPNAERIESTADAEDLLERVVLAGSEEPILTGVDVVPSASYRQANGSWGVDVQFTAQGSSILQEFTTSNRGEYLAVFYNGRLVSAAQVQDPITGGRAHLTGFQTARQAQSAANQINMGVLPCDLEIKSIERY